MLRVTSGAQAAADWVKENADCPSPDVLAAIADTRAEGRRVVLVTGRILAQLRSA